LTAKNGKLKIFVCFEKEQNVKNKSTIMFQRFNCQLFTRDALPSLLVIIDSIFYKAIPSKTSRAVIFPCGISFLNIPVF
jgi:hypothetical protein